MSTFKTFYAQAGMRLTDLPALFNPPTGYFNPGKPLGPKAFNRQDNISAYDESYYTPYTSNWSLRIQREVMKNTVATIAYVGNKANVFDPNAVGAKAPNPVERYLDGVVVYGTPESVVD